MTLKHFTNGASHEMSRIAGGYDAQRNVFTDLQTPLSHFWSTSTNVFLGPVASCDSFLRL